MGHIEIDADIKRIDRDLVYGFIANSYWGKGRSRQDMDTCIDNSICYGIYLHDVQIGFARLITDYAQFAYLMDVFILQEYRGKGYGKKLVDAIINDVRYSSVKVWRLATRDAHSLYRHFGFTDLGHPEMMMELKK